ncbi:MAG: FtsX-like permease family protein [Acidobacteriaceae bacterium]|nr:FtsX-like permease family protein [Acidobacteriaceae bacterium]
MALGAKPKDIVSGVLRSGMRLALWGTLSGLVLGFAFFRFLRSLLYEVSAADPLTFGLASLVGIVAAAAACILPALRATRVRPISALRAD